MKTQRMQLKAYREAIAMRYSAFAAFCTSSKFHSSAFANLHIARISSLWQKTRSKSRTSQFSRAPDWSEPTVLNITAFRSLPTNTCFNSNTIQRGSANGLCIAHCSHMMTMRTKSSREMAGTQRLIASIISRQTWNSDSTRSRRRNLGTDTAHSKNWLRERNRSERMNGIKARINRSATN